MFEAHEQKGALGAWAQSPFGRAAGSHIPHPREASPLRYILFHGKRHPAEMVAPEITRFLSSLAVDGNVAAST